MAPAKKRKAANSVDLPRTTRSTARQAALDSAASAASSSAAATPAQSRQPAPSRKRKAPARDPSPPPPEPESEAVQSSRRPKRQKTSESAIAAASSPSRSRKGKGTAASAMSTSGPSAGSPTEPTSTSTKRKSSRTKKDTSAGASSTGRRAKKANSTKDSEVSLQQEEEKATPPVEPSAASPEGTGEHDDEDDDEDIARDYEEDEDDDDPFGGFGAGPPHGLSSTLRALSGMMSGVATKLRDILNNLKQKDDPSVQLIALQELSEILLISTEDNLSGHFSPDAFVKELVALMQPSEFGEENPEMMLLACRCIANLMEALPASIANVVYGGAVPILCQKLLEINYIDLAEQALSTLEKISVDYPATIVREGGLTACLTYLDFFATSTQRTAVITAANCCRNIPEDSFHVIREVMPILLNVLGSSDQKVVEQGSLCVTRVIESFRGHTSKVEELVSTDLLKAMLRLLLPGTTNLIGPSIHTKFLQALGFIATASPRLSAELFKLNVVETLYQILTGVSPPSGIDGTKIDSVVIVQALIHRPRDQIIETLNVICELLPGVARDSFPHMEEGSDSRPSLSPIFNAKRLELLETECKNELKHFAIILIPTLADAFSSTVNLNVRQKVLTAHLKMLSNLDSEILAEALKSVPYASFLAAILSQQDHPSLVIMALQAAEILLRRLDSIYRYQFYREGVISEVTKLAEAPVPDDVPVTTSNTELVPVPAIKETPSSRNRKVVAVDREHEGDTSDDDEDEDDDENEHDDAHDDITASPVSSRGSTMSLDGRPDGLPTVLTSMQQTIAERAKKFLEIHEQEANGKQMKKKAQTILHNLQELAKSIEKFYLQRGPGDGIALFSKLASHFDDDVLESVTSNELLESEVVRALLDVFSNPDEQLRNDARSTFLQVFIGRTVTPDSSTTPFSILIHKLQDLLSRTEHFEVNTVHQNTIDGSRSSAASMLAKQIRLRLIADEDSQIPRPYRNIMVSIHAIATFKALDDYLRPRINLAEKPRGMRTREGLSSALAALAGMSNPMSTNPYDDLQELQAARTRMQARANALGASAPASEPIPPPTAPSTRSSHKAKSKSKASASSTSAAPSQEKPRRSGRRHQAMAEPPTAPQEESDLATALECADERSLEDEDMDNSSAALDAIVGDLDEDMVEDSPPENKAVNLEVASTGKVTARTDGGSRVATPSQFQLRRTAAPSTPAATYLQGGDSDWHLEFTFNGVPISNEQTIYAHIHSQDQVNSARNVWAGVHTIKFGRVAGKEPEPSLSGSQVDTSPEAVAKSLEDHPETACILRLLGILHALNANLDDVLVGPENNCLKLNVEPLSTFVNTKLTAKLNRQLEEPLIVASNCLPIWSEDLARLYPFVFPFETRHLFLQSTSFGYARSMARWQNAQTEETTRNSRRDERPFLGRLQRQKVRISRSKILESALKVMELYGASQSILEVEYFEEVGTGLGPTLEFYSTVSKEFSKKKLKMWRDTDSNGSDEYAFGSRGMFPAPLSQEQAATDNGKRILHLFKMLGKFVARSMIDSRIIDVSFNATFFRIGDGSKTVPPSLGAVKAVDPQLAASLKLVRQFAVAKKAIDENGEMTAAQKVHAAEDISIAGVCIDDLGLDFTLPGYPSIELLPNGAQTQVTIENVGLYVEKVTDMTLASGVQRQVDAFRAGFSQVFPYSALRAFTPDELVMLFGRVDEDWSIETLLDSIKADHGFNMDSKSVRNLLQTMSELTLPDRRDFLQFTTGSPKLPIGGFKSLTPMFTVVCKPSEPPYASDDYLPSVMTCVNYLKLPDYSDLEVMRRRMYTAIKEGQGAFHLS